MRIELNHIGKKFNSEWIFRDVSFTFESNQTSAILGRNGSGKSTLLQVIAGNIHSTAGVVNYTFNGNQIPDPEIFRYLALVAPYQELIEEFTLPEMLDFHFAFKSYIPGFSRQKTIDLLGFPGNNHKHIRQFSSGMKQRVKLVIAIMSNVPLLLFDEPAMNLDQSGIDWYLQLMNDFTKTRTVIICSNQHRIESGFASSKLMIEEFKK
ncbi:MAG: ATP-binding cassette domain-containing protein [Bacteroidales bacterium]|jgi:ABC-type multidrug transport system ATPase subunit|nr:ATP-binding cassette domain-containing protein [Bacteroidales bacterium]